MYEQLENIYDLLELKSYSIDKFIISKMVNVIEAYKNTDDVLIKNRLIKSVIEKATYYRRPDSKKPDDFTITLYPRN